MMTNIDIPFHFDANGETAQPADQDAHIRNLIRQVLLVSRGERVNRPTFGSGLLNLPFRGNSVELANAVQLSLQGELLRWLGDLIEVVSVQTVNEDAVMRITVVYRVRRTGAVGTATADRAILGGSGG